MEIKRQLHWWEAKNNNPSTPFEKVYDCVCRLCHTCVIQSPQPIHSLPGETRGSFYLAIYGLVAGAKSDRDPVLREGYLFLEMVAKELKKRHVYADEHVFYRSLEQVINRQVYLPEGVVTQVGDIILEIKEEMNVPVDAFLIN